ncbi:MAG TPA: hypothetical protein VEW66_01675 [Thermomicrobiales bacterium]|nr:hypothetical protein [Thermomicrobiales bacterium]
MVMNRTTLHAHVVASRQILARRSAQVGMALVVGSLLLSIVLAPGTTASGWDWVRLWLAAFCGGAALLTTHLAQRSNPAQPIRQQFLVLAAVLVVIASVLNLTFSIGTTALFTLVLIVAGYLTLLERTPMTGRDSGAIIAVLVPFWVWSALDAWSPGLLVLLPLVVIGVVVDGHMRRTTPTTADALSPRGHRLAAWLGVLGSALGIALLSLLTNHAVATSALAGAGAVILIGLEAASPSPAEGPWRVSSVAIIDAAMAWIGLCWLAGLS